MDTPPINIALGMLFNDNNVPVKVKRTIKGIKNATDGVNNANLNLSKSSNKLTKAQRKAATYERYLDVARKGTGMSRKFVQRGMVRSNLEFQRGGKIIDGLTGGNVDLDKAMKRVRNSSRRFKMEWLSVMFAGMALSRTFGGLINTQLELFGVTELMSAAWTLVLLPAMELITPILYWLIESFMNLPDSIKMAISGFILFAAIAGTLMMVIGQVALAVGGLAMIFGGPLGIILLASAAALATFVFYLIGAAKASGELKKELTTFGIPPDIFYKLTSGLSSFFDSIKSNLPKLWEKIKEFFSRFLQFVISKIPDFIKRGGDIIMAIANGIANNIGKIINAITFLIDKIVSWLNENIGKLLGAGLSIVLALVQGIVDNIPKIISAVTTIVNSIANFLASNTETIIKLIEGGLDILKAIAQGISDNIDVVTDAIAQVIESLLDWISANGPKLLEVGLKIAAGIVVGISKGLENSFANWLGLNNEINTISSKKGSVPGLKNGGYVPNTGLAMLHAGETVVPANKSGQGINLNVSYDINVSEKSQMEKMINENNRSLVEDLRRLINI